MSSRRSLERRGRAIGTTFSRWKSSVRKRPARDLAREVAGGRRDHPHVDAHRVGAADALERLVDQHAQDLRLRAERHVGDLVEEQDPGVRPLEQAGLDAALGALAAEQHLLHLVGPDRGGVDRDEGPLGPVGVARGCSAPPPPCRQPAGPVSITRLFVRATLSSWRFSARKAALVPIIAAAVTSRPFSAAFSRRSREVSSARPITTISWSMLNGFSMKS